MDEKRILYEYDLSENPLQRIILIFKNGDQIEWDADRDQVHISVNIKFKDES
ncbi:MAG: hypothetical protein ACTSYB_06410 [Candidatus Helarchaeota archaeon]